MTRLLLLAVALALAACAHRPLTGNERALLAAIHGDMLDMDAVRLGDRLARYPLRTYPPRPRLTCQERLFPPRTEPYEASPGAVAIFEHVHVRSDLYSPDLARRTWQGREVLDLLDAMLLAHEMTHVWQWQNREITGYHPLKAALEHVGAPDPYLFDPEAERDFLSFGYEQQGSIVEEWVCCRLLAPDAARTARLERMIGAVMPLGRIEDAIPQDILLPWAGVETEGICD